MEIVKVGTVGALQIVIIVANAYKLNQNDTNRSKRNAICLIY